MKDEDELGIAGTSHLTDVDWAEINRLKRIHESGGGKSLKAALEQSRGDDPVRWTRIEFAVGDLAGVVVSRRPDLSGD